MFNTALPKFMSLQLRLQKLCWKVAITGLSVLIWSSLSAAPATSGGGKHCLWRVTNAKAPFYVLGTVHSLPLRNWKSPPAIENAIHESHQFWFEIDPNRGDLFTKKLTTAARYPKGTTIRDKIDPKTYATLVRISDSSFSNFWQNLRPWAIAMIMFDPR